MRAMISLTAALAICAYSNQAQAQAAPDNGASPAGQPTTPAAQPMTPAAETPAPAAMPAAAVTKAAAFQLNGTTWTFTDKDGKKVTESIDSKGNFIGRSADGKEIDH